MLHYVHQLVTNFVCLLFGAGQIVYSWFYQSFFAKKKKLLAATESMAMIIP